MLAFSLASTFDYSGSLQFLNSGLAISQPSSGAIFHWHIYVTVQLRHHHMPLYSLWQQDMFTTAEKCNGVTTSTPQSLIISCPPHRVIFQKYSSLDAKKKKIVCLSIRVM
jgi:hypothetical protein